MPFDSLSRAQQALNSRPLYQDPTTSQTVTQPAGTDLGDNRLNQVRYAHLFPGEGAGEQLTACINDLPSGGGTCDARGFGGGPQVISDTVIVGSKQRPVTLLCDPATTFQPASTTTNMFRVGANGMIQGATLEAKTSGYTVNMISFLDTYTDGELTGLRDVRILGFGQTTGTAVLMQVSPWGEGQGQCFVSMRRLPGSACGIARRKRGRGLTLEETEALGELVRVDANAPLAQVVRRLTWSLSS